MISISICRDIFMQRVRKQVEDIYGDRLTGGSGITIAVLDTGVGRHPDLTGKTVCFKDFLNNRNLIYKLLTFSYRFNVFYSLNLLKSN